MSGCDDRSEVEKWERIAEKRKAHNAVVLPAEIVEQLGKVPDEKLARLAGCDMTTVFDYRKRLGIGPACPTPLRVNWLSDMDKLLGTSTDKQIGLILGLSAGAIGERRRKLGIAPYDKRKKSTIIWTKPMIAVLGKAPDKDVAKRFRISTTPVAAKRQALGIPPFTHSTKPIGWSAMMLQDLRDFSPQEFLLRYPISREARNSKRLELGLPRFEQGSTTKWTAEMIGLLGLKKDIEIARRFGVTRYVVNVKRKALGIKPYSRWGPEEIALLGSMPDTTLAARLGMKKGAVVSARNRRNIPPFGATYSNT